MPIKQRTYRIEYGQNYFHPSSSIPIDVLDVLDCINASEGDAFLEICCDAGYAIQTLRTAEGFIVEMRYLLNDGDGDDFAHYRAWDCSHHSDPGAAEQLGCEWGAHFRERDYLNIYQAASIITKFKALGESFELPVAKGIHWRDVTDEFLQ
ncbi:MAG: hypothetical protein ACSHX6_01730 [Akkermansiaceae bacterium]